MLFIQNYNFSFFLHVPYFHHTGKRALCWFLSFSWRVLLWHHLDGCFSKFLVEKPRNLAETSRQVPPWIESLTDLPRFCRVVIGIKHQNSILYFCCWHPCMQSPDQSESSFETISEFQSSVSSIKAFCKEPLYLPWSRLMHMKCKAARNSRHWPFPMCS